MIELKCPNCTGKLTESEHAFVETDRGYVFIDPLLECPYCGSQFGRKALFEPYNPNIVNTGPGAVATGGGTAAGKGGIAVRGNVTGGISTGGDGEVWINGKRVK